MRRWLRRHFVLVANNHDPAMSPPARSDLVPWVQTSLWPALGLFTSSSLLFSIYIGKVTNSHEWKEIFIDYCHHKRTMYSGNGLDTAARGLKRFLRIAPK